MSSLHRFRGLKVLLFVLGVSASSLASAAAWVSTGGPLGGLGYDVRIHPSNKSVMYVTDNSAGVSKSINAGQTWSRSNSGITTKGGSSGDAVNIFSLTIDPNNPNTIWAGTFGDGQAYGVFKSTDAGGTWTMKIKGISLGGDFSLIFRGFTIQQGNSNVVYAQTEVRPLILNGWKFFRSKGRVYKTVDGGENWQMIWEGNDLARYLIIDPGNPNVLYVSHGIFDIEPFDSDCKNGVYAGVGVLKSSDGGLTWSAINNGLTDLSVGSLRMHPTNSQILFAATGNVACSGFGTPNFLSGVFKTTNGGASWTKVIAAQQGEPFTAVNFSPANPNTVYAGSPHAFYRSDDLGATWTAHGKAGLPMYGPPGVGAGFPIDVVIDPDNADTVYVNNYAGGIFRSLDGTATWETWSKGYTGAAIRRIAIPAGNPAALAVIGRSGPFVSPNYGGDWVGIYTGDAAAKTGNVWHTVAVHPTDPQVMLLADSVWGIVVRSTDNGNNFTQVFKDANAASSTVNDPLRSQGFRGLAFAPSDPNIVYGGVSVDTHYYAPTPTGTVIYKSVDSGVTFSAVPSIIDGNNVNRLIVDANDANKVYAATTNGVYKSTNGAASWTYSSTLGNRKIEALAVKSGTLIAGEVAGGIWTSADDGASWTGPHNSGISSAANPTISALVFDAVNSNVVYAGDFYSGVYKSSDKGLTWSPFPDSSMSGMDNRAINDLVLTNEVLYAATEGGGVFRYDFLSTAVPTCTLSASPSTIAPAASATLTATCSPAATSYAWTGGTCAGTSAASCTVIPSTTTSYSVAGINGGGTGAAASATVTLTTGTATNPGSACASPLYCGSIIDNHAHPIGPEQGNQNDYFDGLVTLMDQNGVTMTGLHRNAQWVTGTTEFSAAHDLWVTAASQRHPGRILTYLAGFDPSSPAALTYITDQFRTSDQWKTIGELDLRNPGPKTQIPINSTNMMAILKLAAQLRVPVSIHYEFEYGVDLATGKRELEEALSANPDTTVILAHTPMPELMAKHPNLWAEFTPWGPQAEQILANIVQSDPTLLDRVVLCATDLQGPDLKVGAGLATPITYGDAIATVRKVLGTLTQAQAEKIAYKNLVKLLNLTVPACTLAASSSTITPGASTTLTATCSPEATSYVWSGGTCTGTSGASCTTTPTATTTYSVAGTNAIGTGTSASASVTISTTQNPSDCLFNWVERSYPQLFAPAGVASRTLTPYYYRYYSQTGNYMATSSADNHFLVLGPSFGPSPLDVGPIANFLSMAGCSP